MTMQAGTSGTQSISTAPPAIRDIHAADAQAALREGWADFTANPTHWVFLGISTAK